MHVSLRNTCATFKQVGVRESLLLVAEAEQISYYFTLLNCSVPTWVSSAYLFTTPHRQ